jgi:hypothetical protein
MDAFEAAVYVILAVTILVAACYWIRDAVRYYRRSRNEYILRKNAEPQRDSRNSIQEFKRSNRP